MAHEQVSTRPCFDARGNQNVRGAQALDLRGGGRRRGWGGRRRGWPERSLLETRGSAARSLVRRRAGRMKPGGLLPPPPAKLRNANLSARKALAAGFAPATEK